jgi:hypothetical protein
MRLRPSRQFWFGVFLLGIAVLATLAGVEAFASLYSPAWPARALRPIEPVNVPPEGVELPAWMKEPFNSWGMRDRERSLIRPHDVYLRSVFVGDSFVEFLPLPKSLPAAVEARFAERDHRPIEAIDLGISGTGPISYYYRIRDVALAMSPDALALFFFSGNDFLRDGQGFAQRWLPPLIDESPGRSIVGRIMPRTNWLLVNRLREAELLRDNKPVPDEFATLQRIVEAPRQQRLAQLVRHMQRHYFPNVPEQRLSEILSRGDGRLLDLFGGNSHEYLMGWLLNLILRAELDPTPFNSVHNAAEADAQVWQGNIDATLSWLVATDELAHARHVPLQLFVIPVAAVDPQFVEFWRPWPHYYSWYLYSEAQHARLVKALKDTTVSFTDLRPAFDGQSGTYRKSDAHWTQRGLDIATGLVFDRLCETWGKSL